MRSAHLWYQLVDRFFYTVRAYITIAVQATLLILENLRKLNEKSDSTA